MADLGVIHMILFFQAYKMQELWSHGGFQPDFKDSLGSQAMCGRVRIPIDSPSEGYAQSCEGEA
jgi:hypothetical protein